MKRLPAFLTIAYLSFYIAVLGRSVIWSVGDQTDVIMAGLAAFPIGFFLSFSYPGGRTGAFVAVSIAAAVNAVCIFYVTRWVVRWAVSGRQRH